MIKCKTEGCNGNVVLLKAHHLVRVECLDCGTIYMVTDRESWDEQIEEIMKEVEPED